MNEENLVKKVCKELGLTYKELGTQIGVKESTLKSVASTNKVSTSLKKAISLYLENVELKQELAKTEQLKSLLKDLTK